MHGILLNNCRLVVSNEFYSLPVPANFSIIMTAKKFTSISVQMGHFLCLSRSVRTVLLESKSSNK